MKAFLLIAVLFLTVSCTSSVVREEEYPCSAQADFIFSETVDQLLLEACYGEMLNQCHPEDGTCHFYGQLLCTKEFLRSKADSIELFIKDECYREFIQR